ncbi:MAG TPA: F390 synthetase-related protein [Magnetospirillum sp.]|nr:F390 synthetase-related protein [Magnetospirillum sp.]
MLTLLADFAAARWRRFADRAALERFQQRRMAAFRRQLLARLPLYRELADQPLDRFPIADKAFVRQHFAGLNILGLSYDQGLALARAGAEQDGITIGMSSGTSGNRGLFLVSRAERRRWAAVMLGKALPPGGLLRRHRVALLLAADSRLYSTTQDSGRLAYRFFDLKQGLDAHVAALQAYAPTLMVAPAHVLGLLARRQLDGQLRLAPQRAFSAAEVLDPAEAQVIAAAWGAPVHQIYQCTEGFLGITCAHGTLHLNEDYVLVEKEWIDQGRRAFNPVITDFSRRTQAMVRYRMNDVLIAAARPCACGSPLQAIERVEGRRDDLLVFPGASGGRVIMFPDDVRATLLDAAPAATDFTLVQPTPERVELALAGAVPDGQRAAAERAFGLAVARLGGVAPEISRVAYQPPADHAAKLRRVRRGFAWDGERQ